MRQKCQKKHHSRRGRRAGHRPKDGENGETGYSGHRPVDLTPKPAPRGLTAAVTDVYRSVTGGSKIKKSSSESSATYASKASAGTQPKNQSAEKPIKVEPVQGKQNADEARRPGKTKEAPNDTGKSTQKGNLVESAKPSKIQQRQAAGTAKGVSGEQKKESVKEDVQGGISKKDTANNKGEESRILKSDNSPRIAGEGNQETKSPKKGKREAKQISEENTIKDMRHASVPETSQKISKKAGPMEEMTGQHQTKKTLGGDASDKPEKKRASTGGSGKGKETKSNIAVELEQTRDVKSGVPDSLAQSSDIEMSGAEASSGDRVKCLPQSELDKDAKQVKIAEEESNQQQDMAKPMRSKKKSEQSMVAKREEKIQPATTPFPVKEVVVELGQSGTQTSIPKYSDILRSSKKPTSPPAVGKTAEDVQKMPEKSKSLEEAPTAGDSTVTEVCREKREHKTKTSTSSAGMTPVISGNKVNKPESSCKGQAEDKGSDKKSDPNQSKRDSGIQEQSVPPTTETSKEERCKKTKEVQASDAGVTSNTPMEAVVIGQDLFGENLSCQVDKNSKEDQTSKKPTGINSQKKSTKTVSSPERNAETQNVKGGKWVKKADSNEGLPNMGKKSTNICEESLSDDEVVMPTDIFGDSLCESEEIGSSQDTIAAKLPAGLEKPKVDANKMQQIPVAPVKSTGDKSECDIAKDPTMSNISATTCEVKVDSESDNDFEISEDLFGESLLESDASEAGIPGTKGNMDSKVTEPNTIPEVAVDLSKDNDAVMDSGSVKYVAETQFVPPMPKAESKVDANDGEIKNIPQVNITGCPVNAAVVNIPQPNTVAAQEVKTNCSKRDTSLQQEAAAIQDRELKDYVKTSSGEYVQDSKSKQTSKGVETVFPVKEEIVPESAVLAENVAPVAAQCPGISANDVKSDAPKVGKEHQIAAENTVKKTEKMPSESGKSSSQTPSDSFPESSNKEGQLQDKSVKSGQQPDLPLHDDIPVEETAKIATHKDEDIKNSSKNSSKDDDIGHREIKGSDAVDENTRLDKKPILSERFVTPQKASGNNAATEMVSETPVVCEVASQAKSAQVIGKDTQNQTARKYQVQAKDDKPKSKVDTFLVSTPYPETRVESQPSVSDKSNVKESVAKPDSSDESKSAQKKVAVSCSKPSPSLQGPANVSSSHDSNANVCAEELPAKSAKKQDHVVVLTTDESKQCMIDHIEISLAPSMKRQTLKIDRLQYNLEPVCKGKSNKTVVDDAFTKPDGFTNEIRVVEGKTGKTNTDPHVDPAVNAYLVEEASRLQLKVQAEASEERNHESLAKGPVSTPTVLEDKVKGEKSMEVFAKSAVPQDAVMRKEQNVGVGKASVDPIQQAIYQDMAQDCIRMKTRVDAWQAEINFYEKHSKDIPLLLVSPPRLQSVSLGTEDDQKEIEEEEITPEEEIVAMAAPPKRPSSAVQQYSHPQDVMHGSTNNQGAVIAAVLQECQTLQLRLSAERAETTYNENQLAHPENDSESLCSDTDLSDKENLDPKKILKNLASANSPDVKSNKDDIAIQHTQTSVVDLKTDVNKSEVVCQDSEVHRGIPTILTPTSPVAGRDINVFLDMEMTVENEDPTPLVEPSPGNHLDTIEEERTSTASREDILEAECQEGSTQMGDQHTSCDQLKSVYVSLAQECEQMWKLNMATKSEALHHCRLSCNTHHNKEESEKFADMTETKEDTNADVAKAVQEYLVNDQYWRRLYKEAEVAEKRFRECFLSPECGSAGDNFEETVSKSTSITCFTNPHGKVPEVENTKTAITTKSRSQITVVSTPPIHSSKVLGEKCNANIVHDSHEKDTVTSESHTELNQKTSPVCCCKDATSQTEIEFSICCKCGLLSLPLPAQLTERLKQALLRQAVAEKHVDGIEADLQQLKQCLKNEKQKVSKLEERNFSLEAELKAEQTGHVQLENALADIKSKLNERELQIQKLEDQIDNTSVMRSHDVLNKARLAASQAAETQVHLKETEVELRESQYLVLKLQEDLARAVQDMSVMVTSQDHDEALRLETQRAHDAEVKASQLELQLAKLQGEKDSWLSGLEPDHKSDDPWKTPSSSAICSSSGLFSNLGSYYQTTGSTFSAVGSSAFPTQTGPQFSNQHSAIQHSEKQGFGEVLDKGTNEATDDPTSGISFHDLDEKFSMAGNMLSDLYPESSEAKVTSSGMTTTMGSTLGTYSMLYGSLGHSSYGQPSKSTEDKTAGRLFGSSLYDSTTARALFGEDYASTSLTSSYIAGKYDGSSSYGQETGDYGAPGSDRTSSGQDSLGLAGIVGSAGPLPTSSSAVSLGSQNLPGSANVENISMWSTSTTGTMATGVVTVSPSESESGSDWSSSSEEPNVEVSGESAAPGPVGGFSRALPPGILPKPTAVKHPSLVSLPARSKPSPTLGSKPSPPPGKPRLPSGCPAAGPSRSKPPLLPKPRPTVVPKPRLRKVFNANHAPVNAGAGAAEAGEERGVSFEEGHQEATLRPVKKPRGPPQRRRPHRYQR